MKNICLSGILQEIQFITMIAAQGQSRRVKFVDKTNSQFFTVLKDRVDEYFESNHKSHHANFQMVLKTVSLLSLYIVPFILIIWLQPSFPVQMILWLLMGAGLSGVGMSIMHDANHGAYSENKTINKILGHTLNLAGGSVQNWKLQHNILHHTYTNVAHLDEDINDKLVLRFNPHTKVKAVQKLQFVYAFFFYGITTIYWALLKDFIQHKRYVRSGLNSSGKNENNLLLFKMVVDKLIYFAVLFGLPLMAGISFLYVLAGFLVMHFAAGIILTVVFQLAHTVEGTSHPLPDESGNIDNAWAIHQLHTTVNFSHGNPFLTWYLGGLNYQIEHHLFPRICHIHYPAIAPIVKRTAKEFGIPYLENKTFREAFNSHVATLKRFGKLPSLTDAIS